MVSVATWEQEEAQQLTGTTHGLPLSDVLDSDSFAGVEVLAGRSGLDRVVSGLNVMEVPDVLAWVKPGELILTTGFALLSPSGRVRTDEVIELVRGLDGKGLAGFGIKLGRYVDELPSEVLAVADELGFPIVRLPAGVAFDDLLKDAYARLNTIQSNVLEQIDALHTALTMIVLEGGDLEQIAAEVSRVLSVGIAITSTDGREWAAALDITQRAVLEESGLVDETGRLRVERARIGPVPVAGGELRVLYVAASGTELARLVVLSDDRVLRSSDVHALERAATVAALLITRRQAVTAVEGKYRGDFLRDVFQSRAGSTQYVVEHAAGLGWDLDRPMVVVVAQLDPPAIGEVPAAARTRRGWQDRFAAAWRQVVEARDRSIAVADFSAEVVALLPTGGGTAGTEGGSGTAATGDDVVALVRSTVAEVRGDRGGGRRSFSAGISRVARSIEELPAAYAHARKAADVGRRIKGPGSTTFFDDLGVRRLLSLIEDPEELDDFAREVLGELADATSTAADLRTTLQVLLDTNLNVAEAARIQHFHYNTMRYRVTKLEGLLGPFSTDPNVRLDVAVALQIIHLAER